MDTDWMLESADWEMQVKGTTKIYNYTARIDLYIELVHGLDSPMPSSLKVAYA